MRLLLNLLAKTHGPSTSLRVLALFDPEFNKEMKIKSIDTGEKIDGKVVAPKIRMRQSAQNIIVDDSGEFEQEKVEVYNLDVSFDDAPALTDGVLSIMKCYEPDTSFMYTIELFPPTKKTSVIACTRDQVTNSKDSKEKSEETELEKLENGTELREKSTGQFKETLEDLEIKQEYTVRVNTVVNGKTLSSKVIHLDPIKSKNE